MAQKYPQDEFDDLSSVHKVGAHRAAERGWRSARILIGALAVTALLVAGVYGALQVVRNGSVFNEYVAASDDSASAEASTEASEAATDDADATATESASPSETTTPSAEPEQTTAAVDPYSLTVGVYNGTSRSGLAATAAAQVKAAGWTVSTTTNAPSGVRGQANSVVYYSDAAYADAAQQLADALSLAGGTVQRSIGTTQLSVVLGTTYNR